MLVEEKKQINLTFPAEIADMFNAMVKTDNVDLKKKWAVAAAAFLAFREIPKAERIKRMKELTNADDFGESFSEIIARPTDDQPVPAVADKPEPAPTLAQERAARDADLEETARIAAKHKDHGRGTKRKDQ